MAAKGAVEGAIAGAKELSVDATKAASAAVTGAVKAAGEIGSGVALEPLLSESDVKRKRKQEKNK